MYLQPANYIDLARCVCLFVGNCVLIFGQILLTRFWHAGAVIDVVEGL